MRLFSRGSVLVLATALALAGVGLLTTPAGAARLGAAHVGSATTAGINWGRAEHLRGRPVISGSSGSGQYDFVNSVSCWSANNCAAGGSYYSPDTKGSDFVVVERNGRWGRAEKVPGALGNEATVRTVSCAAGGYCVAGGEYAWKGHFEAFVTTLKNGRWQKALEVPGSYVPYHNAGVNSVSCLARRQCVAAGDNDLGAFVTWQVKGVWQPARILHIGGGSTAMGCWSPVDCVVARGSTVTELNGGWGTPQPITFPYATDDAVTAVACAPDGYCAVTGAAAPGFVASGPHGNFGTAITLPATPATDPASYVGQSVSCPSAGNCVAAADSWVISQTHGIWGMPEQPPGTGTDVIIDSLSCWSAGNCGAVGTYFPGGPVSEPFVASELNGRWTAPEPVPGITALNKQAIPYRNYFSVTCPSPRHCIAAGIYTDARGRQLGFVTGPA
jgi:hypothetical protein